MITPQLEDEGDCVNAYPSSGISLQSGDILCFGDSPQDAISILGIPDHITYCTPEIRSVHSHYGNDYQCDYFYNYFCRGIDVLFDSRTHQVKKIVLHTNFPSHRKFCLYKRCFFRIHLPEDEKDDEFQEESSGFSDDSRLISYLSRLPEIEEYLGASIEKPHYDDFDENQIFGDSYYHVSEDMIFEVTSNFVLIVSDYGKK